MGKNNILCLLMLTASFCVHEVCNACSFRSKEDVEGIIGKNVTLSCTHSYLCYGILWTRYSTTGERINLKSVPNTDQSYYALSEVPFDETNYTCWCSPSPHREPYKICDITLTTLCQAAVQLNGKTTLYNSTSLTNYINVTVGERIKFRCPQNGNVQNNCNGVEEKESGRFTYKLDVLLEHDSCYIKCLLGNENGDSCNVIFTLRVTTLQLPSQPLKTSSVSTSSRPSSTLTTSSAVYRPFTEKPPMWERDNVTPHQSSSFQVIIPVVGVLIFILVGAIFLVCFFIYKSKRKSNSQSKKENVGDSSNDTIIPIAPTYEVVNKSQQRCAKGEVHYNEPDTQHNDDAYADVNNVGKEESSIELTNDVKLDTSITKDYYSVVNTSNTTKLESRNNGSDNDSVMYAEVNKGDVKQTGDKECKSSSCDSSVSEVQSCHVPNQPESSEYDTVCKISPPAALYAVVDKEKKKE